MSLALRQICLVAQALEPATRALGAAFDLAIGHRDPEVAHFGLENALLPVGSDFLEIVAPVRPGTAAGRHLDRRGGDGGYMVILESDAAEWHADRIRARGVRLAFEVRRPDYLGFQFHPGDTGGAFLEIHWTPSVTDPAALYAPAGPDWRQAVRTDRVRGLAAARIQSADPLALARRWGDLLDRPVALDEAGDPVIALDRGALIFTLARDGRGEGLGGVDLIAGPRGPAGPLTLCGTRFQVLDRPAG